MNVKILERFSPRKYVLSGWNYENNGSILGEYLQGMREIYWSCDCICTCPVCGSPDAERCLGGVPYEQIVAERGEPAINRIKSEFVRKNPS